MQGEGDLSLPLDGGVAESHGKRTCVIVDIGAATFGQTDPATGIMWLIGLVGQF